MNNFDDDVKDVLAKVAENAKNKRSIQAENDKKHVKHVKELVDKITYTQDDGKVMTGVDYLLADYRYHILEKAKKSAWFRFKLRHAKQVKIELYSYTNVTGIKEVKSALFNYIDNKFGGGYNTIRVSEDYPLYVGVKWDSYGFPTYFLMAERNK